MTLLLNKSMLAGLVGAAMMIGAASAASAADVKYITIGTGGPTGVYFVVGNSVCRLVNAAAAEGRDGDQNHLRCSAPSTAGSTYNIGQICAGELDFGVAQSDWQYHAYKGDSDKVTKCPKLRAMFSVHSEPYQVIAGADSGIKSWADLKGKRFNIGNPGSGQRGTTEELMAGRRHDDGRLRRRHRADLDRAVDGAVRRQHRRLRLHGRRSRTPAWRSPPTAAVPTSSI